VTALPETLFDSAHSSLVFSASFLLVLTLLGNLIHFIVVSFVSLPYTITICSYTASLPALSRRSEFEPRPKITGAETI
jgi:hypothetical protein